MSVALPHVSKLAAIPAPAAPARPVALRLDGVTKQHGYGDDAVIALDTMSLSGGSRRAPEGRGRGWPAS